MKKRTCILFFLMLVSAGLLIKKFLEFKSKRQSLDHISIIEEQKKQVLPVIPPTPTPTIVLEEEALAAEKKWTQALQKIRAEEAKLKQENRTSELSKFETLGYRCSVVSKETLVIKNQKTWATLLRRMGIETSTSLFPNINFQTHMIAAVFTGEQPFTEKLYLLDSQEFQRRSTGKTLVIFYRQTFAPKGSTISSIMIQPYHLRIFPAYAGPIEFKEVQ